MKNLNLFTLVNNSIINIKDNFIPYFIVFFLPSFIINILPSIKNPQNIATIVIIDIISIIVWIITFVLSYSGIYMILHKTPSIMIAIKEFLSKKLLNIIIYSVIFIFVFVTAFSLFVIPGFILGLFLIFSRFVIIEKNVDCFEAMAESYKLIKGNFWNIVFYIGLIIFLLSLLPTWVLYVNSYYKIITDLSVLNIVYSIIVSFITMFIYIYSISIYKLFTSHHEHNNDNKEVNINRIKNIFKIMSIIGVILLILIIQVLISLLKSNPELLTLLQQIY